MRRVLVVTSRRQWFDEFRRFTGIDRERCRHVWGMNNAVGWKADSVAIVYLGASATPDAQVHLDILRSEGAKVYDPMSEADISALRAWLDGP